MSVNGKSKIECIAVDSWNTMEEWKNGDKDAWRRLMELHDQMYDAIIEEMECAAGYDFTEPSLDPHHRFKAVAHLN